VAQLLQNLLPPAAIEAVQQWKYKPYLLNGPAVEIETQVQVNFVLKPQQPST
jgi:protein TonB